MDKKAINVTLNTFDAAGNQVDTDNMDLTQAQISDIVDHAAQLTIVMRDMAQKKAGIESFDHVYAELEEALTTAGVVAESDSPMPTLTLPKAL